MTYGEVSHQGFESGSGIALFVEFEGRMSTLRRFLDAGDSAIGDDLQRQSTEVDQLAEQFARGGEVDGIPFTAYEATMVEREALCASREHFREYLYASVLAVVLSVFEAFLDDMMEVARASGLADTPLRPGKGPYVNRALRYLQEVCSLPLGLDKAHIRRLDLLRKARNSFVHSLGRDLPDHIRSELAALFREAEHPDFEWSHSFCVKAIETIEGIVGRLETAFVAATKARDA